MQRLAIALSLVLLLAAAGPAAAAPTAQVAGGHTTVELSEELLGALGTLGVAAAPIGPGSLRRGHATFPIPGGALDLETARGDVFHTGGLSLRAGETEVQLLNFVIDTQNEPVLTGLVSVNGDLVGRVPLFDLSLTQSPDVWRNYLVVRGVEVTLSATAGGALNDIFGVDDFVEGLPIGDALLYTRILDPAKKHGRPLGWGWGRD